MPVTLATLEARRGELRRALAAKSDERQTKLEALDAQQAKVDDLSAKISAKVQSQEDPSDDEKGELESARKQYKDMRSGLLSLSDDIRRMESELAEANADYALRADHNRLESDLQNSAGDTNGSQIGGDGGSLGDGPGGSGNSAARASGARVLTPDAETVDHDLGVLFQSQIISQIDHVDPATVARDYLGNERVAGEIQAAQSANDFSRGGAWISGVYLDRYIELLRPFSIIRNAGIDSIPLDDGTVTMPEEVAGPAGKYLGENEESDTEEVKTGQVKLVSKELVVQVVSSEVLLRSRSANAAARIRTSVLRGAGQTEDLYFIRGSASGAGPTGLRYQADSANIIAANGTVNATNVIDDMGKAELALLDGNVVEMNPFWIMAPRVFVYLSNLRDSDGWVFPDMRGREPTFNGKPVFTTTQIPVNLGTGSNESEVMLIEGAHQVIGDVPEVGFESSNTAAYNSGGTVKAAFSNRQVVSRLVMGNDIKSLQKKSIAVLTGVKWGS